MTSRHLPTLLSPRQLPTKGPYARVPYCDEHRTYTKGCDKCRRYGAWHKRVHTLRVESGERITVPLAEVRPHLDKLTAAGMTPREICEVTGLSKATLKGPLYKQRGFLAAWVAEKILAVPVPTGPASPPPLSHVTDATGTLRRVRALARIGWTYGHIADAAGTSHRIEHIAGQKWVTHEVAAAIARAYDLLSMTPGPSSRTAGRAARAGWAPPLAWDDIDDPNAEPVLDAEPAGEADTYDEITVSLAVDGRLTYEQIRTHRPDLIETVRRLAQRMTDIEIAHHLRWPRATAGPDGKSRGQEAVCKLRNREGIPGPDKYEAVYAYRPAGKRSRGRQSVQAAYMPNQVA